MATCHYFLVGVLVLAALVNGEGDVPEPQSELLNGKANMDTGVLRSHSDGTMKNSILCTACERVVGILKNITENQKLLGELVNVLLPLCDFVPYIMLEDCHIAVNDIPTFMKMYAETYLNPLIDCSLYCKTSHAGLEPNNISWTVTDLVKKMHGGKPNKL